jgi:probable addiction module antidote protein
LTRKAKQPISRSHKDATVDSLRRDPLFAVEYLNDVLADGSEQELMVALRRVADAFGGISKLAGKAKLNATTLYRTLSPKGNPELRSMNSMLRAMGLRLAVEPISKPARKVPTTQTAKRLLMERSCTSKPKDMTGYLRKAAKVAPAPGDKLR